jgi:hypothetical protein
MLNPLYFLVWEIGICFMYDNIYCKWRKWCDLNEWTNEDMEHKFRPREEIQGRNSGLVNVAWKIEMIAWNNLVWRIEINI